MYKITLLAGIALLGWALFSYAAGNSSANATAKTPELNRDRMITNTIQTLVSMKLTDLYGKYLDTNTLEVIDYDTMISRLKGIQVIYAAESHTNTAHHQLQQNILKSISAKNPKTALAMEFLYRSQQGLLDDYIAGKVNDEKFDEAVLEKFTPSWYPMYSPLIRTAKTNKLKLIGLNVESTIKRKMYKDGWDKLTPEEQKLIARDIDLSNKGHRALFERNSAGMKNDPKTQAMMQGPMLEMMYWGQCAWDETFGETISNYLKEKNDKNIQVVVILGSGHADYKFNTPDRAYKRYPASFKTLVPFELNDNKEEDLRKLLTENPLIGDFVFFSPITIQ